MLENMECPYCTGKILELDKSYICENYLNQSCSIKVNKIISNVTLTLNQIKALFKGQRTEFINGFKNKNNQDFNSKLYIDENTYQVSFDTDIVICPKCENGKLKEFTKSYSCSNYRSEKSCGFSVWINQYGATITKENLIEVCTKKETSIISFATKINNTPYNGKLILNDDFSISLLKI